MSAKNGKMIRGHPVYDTVSFVNVIVCKFDYKISCKKSTNYLEFDHSWDVFVNQSLIIWLQGFNIRHCGTFCIQIVLTEKRKAHVFKRGKSPNENGQHSTKL